jgi:NADH-quinone oxidoreductase subunit L
MFSNWIEDFNLTSAAIAVALPFLSFLLIMVFTRPHPRMSAGISIVSIGISMILAIALLALNRDIEAPVQYSGKWPISNEVAIPFGFLLDPLSLLMFTLVALISFLVQVYSLGYMAGDSGFARYYGFQSLFAWAMLTLSISSSMLQLYVFWELVGLSSYLLIGFWYERFSATQAGKKAFVMTRLGDIGLLIGLLLILVHLGNLDIVDLTRLEVVSRAPSGFIPLIAVLVFAAIVGKSAQFPLLTWLPDAMEGPTPVSALLHSATMVAAGVFLFARLFPLFSFSPTAMTVFLTIGTISMLIASTMAMVHNDIKQVWAYSTISQLGLMIMALAAGSLFAGTFHLTTHAAFKALLFLCSGVWIHRFATNDIFEIAKLGGRALKIPTFCLIIAAAALAGLPPLSGFFSKEAAMASLAGLSNPAWLAAGLVGVFLTSYYSFRIVFILLFPTHHARTDRHEEPLYHVMSGPLLILAGLTLIIGFFQTELMQFLGAVAGSASEKRNKDWLFYLTMGVSIPGVFLAWLEFGRKGAAQKGFVERIPALRRFFLERWYLDHFYDWFVRNVIDGFLARLSARNERQVIDETIDRFCRGTLKSGRMTAFLQSGILRHNIIFMFAALVILALFYMTG